MTEKETNTYTDSSEKAPLACMQDFVTPKFDSEVVFDTESDPD